MSVPPRRHRLPQRLDWKLVPPPLDLSKPLVDDKATLPAIIVTPSSPRSNRDFQIAFLAPTPKEESFRERVFSRLSASTHKTTSPLLPQFRPRTLLLVFIPMLLLFCHALVHHLGTYNPRLHFDIHTQGGVIDGADSGDAVGWFDLNDYWGARHAREFIIEERISHAEQ